MVLCLSGCGNWVTHHESPARLGRIENLERIRITRLDSTVVVIEEPIFSRDSVVGVVPGAEPRELLAFALADIAGVERWRDETTAAVWVGIGAGLLLLYTLVQLPWGTEF
jgi:hypothetical protein